MYVDLEKRGAVRRLLPAGRAGTRVTLQLMRQLAERGGSDPVVIDAAARIVRSAGIAGHDALGEIRALFEFCRDRVRYTRDPVGVEMLQSPARILRTRAGDCDDKSTLLVALLRAIGHPARLAFRAIAANPLFPGAFSHVYVIARHRGREIPLDPTPPRATVGWQFDRPSALMEVAL